MSNYWQDKRNAEKVKRFQELPEETQRQLQATHSRREVEQRKSVYKSHLLDILEEAKEFAKEWNKPVDDVMLDHYNEPHEYGDGSSSALDMTVEALETDTQYFIRLIEHYDAAKHRDENDRKEFERLKARFGA